MTDRVTAPYGAWPSPISAADVARGGVRLGFPTVRGEHVWWQETRPESGGRTVVVHRAPDGTCRGLIAEPWNARTRVHEYGGRAYLPVPHGDGYAIVFAHYDDQRLYLVAPDAAPVPLTPEPPVPAGLRYADLIHHAERGEIWCVVEEHDADGAVTRRLAAVPLDGSASEDPAAIRTLVDGAQFYAAPRLSPDGSQLAWITWDHPRMPWDGTRLRIAPVDENGVVGKPRGIKGGPNESVLAPWWRDESTLYLISDWSGWWNPYEVGIYGEPPLSLYPAEEEFCGPPWSLGLRPYVVLGDGRLVVMHGHGDLRLAIIDPETAELADLDVPYTNWAGGLDADGLTVVGIAGAADRPAAVVRLDVASGKVDVLREESTAPKPGYLPAPVETEFEGPFGRPVHAYVYAPASPDAQAPESELPPYVVWVHGGPTGNESGTYDLEKAYFTSRGIGVVDVNYGGSTGYGRAYRERLRQQWGVVDVEDAVAVARSLAESGQADGARLAIRGGSAGGWTTLAAVTTSETFAAGASYFGVSDARRLADETHDFESHYLEGLIGPLPGFAARYAERAPLTNAAATHCPVLLLQGLDDPVVPPAQSERFAAALAERDIPYAYLTFEGESHGFRRAETKIAALEAELSFYGQTLGFTPPDVPKLELTTEPPAPRPEP